MKLTNVQCGISSAPISVSIIHNGEELVWDISKLSFSNFDVFEQINDYWAQTNKNSQDKVFDIYKRIKDVFNTVFDTNALTTVLYSLVAELYDNHDLNDIKHWMDFHSNLILPDGLRDAFKESHETPGTRERTYLKDDYRWLIALSIALRVMVPIWGEFIATTRKDTGTTLKEYYAFQLLAYSSIARSEPMERLRVYAEHSVPMDKSKSAAILSRLSSEDFPVWILSLVVVRRLCVGDIRGIDPTSSLVTTIYKYIVQKVKGHDNNFMGIVKEKIFEGQTQEGENNLSKLEGYKIKQEIPAGDIAIIEQYMKDPFKLALRICPTIDISLIEKSLINVRELETEQIWRPQTILMQWVLKSIIPARAFMYVNKNLTLNAMAVAQALLWNKGHKELAGLISAIEQNNNGEIMFGSTDSRARITKEQLEHLANIYPFSRKPVGKQKVVKYINPASEAIDSLASMFSERDWRLTLSGDMVKLINGNENNRRYSTPYDIKIKLASLAIEIGSRTF